MMAKVFRLSRTLQSIGASLVLVVGVCYLIFIPAGLGKWDAATWLGLLLFTLPFVALGVYWFLRHNGNVILTDDAIIVRHFQFEQRMAYDDVVAFQEKDAHLPPNYVLKSRDGVLKFSRETENFYELYDCLRQKIAVLREAEPVTFPWVLNFMPGFLKDVGAWVGIIGLMLGGMTCWGLRDSKNLSEDVFFIGLTAVLFLALTLAAALPKLKQKPRELIFTAEEIQLQPFWGPPQIFKTAQIQNMLIEERVSVARPIRMAWQKIRVVLHPLIIKFRDGKYLVIEEGQAWQAGYSPERLLDTLRRLYKPQKPGAQLLGTMQNRPQA
jgi:hypothetical protein